MQARLLPVAFAWVIAGFLLLPSALAGPGGSSGGGPPAPGPDPIDGGGGSAGPEGGGSGDSGGAEGGPSHPAPPDVDILPATPPFPNLVVTLLHADRDGVRVGNPLHFYVVVENVGYRYLNNTTVVLVDGLGQGLPIGEANVTLEDFRGSADFTWIPTSVGAHTVRAIADPHAYVEETNETDNESSVIVTVTPGPPIGKPDLRVTSADIDPVTEPIANATVAVNVTVWNVGDASAMSVPVEVWEVERSLQVASYTIGSALAGSSHVQTISWTPDVEGPKHLEARVDPTGSITEHNETDNVASEGFHVRPPGTLVECTTEGDCPNFQPGDSCQFTIFIIYGDLNIPAGKLVWFVNCDILVHGNVFVSGTLLLHSSTLMLMARTNNQYRLEARPGGLVEFLSSDLTPFRSSFGISAMALAGSQFEFHGGSTARWLYGTPDPTQPGGLQVFTSNVLVEASVVSNGQGHGLYIGPGVNAGAVQSNTFLANRGGGMVVSPGAIATIQSNTVQANRFGVYANDASPAITGNTISQNTYGLYFYFRSSATVSGNVIDRNANGIFVSNAWDRLVPAFTAVNVGNSTQFGIYALLSNLTLRDSTVWTTVGGRAGAVVDFLHYGPRSRPVVVNNDFGVRPEYFLVARNVVHANISDNFFLNTWRGTWVMESGGTVRNNTWRDAAGPGCGEVTVCDDFIDWRASSQLSVNHFHPGGAVGILAVRSIASTTTLSRDMFELQEQPPPLNPAVISLGVVAQQGASIRVENATFNRTVNPVLIADRSAGFVAFNRMWRAPWYSLGGNSGAGITIYDTALPSTVLNNTVENYRFQVTLQNATSGGNLVERNTLRAPYYPPGFPWNGGDPNATADRGHVIVYNNASVTVRNNDMWGGAWGVTLDDRESGTRDWRNTYALVEDNSIDFTGYVAVGVDTTTRAEVLRNWINGSGGWAVFIESAFAGNRVERNRVNDTHGVAGTEGCNSSTILLASESGAPTLGEVTVAWNDVRRTNGTALRLCRAEFLNSAYVHNNTMADDRPGGSPEASITVHASSGRRLRIEDNAVEGFLMGIWVKATPMDANADFARNALRGNTDGVRVGYGDTPCAPRSDPRSLNPVRATFRDNVIENNAVGVNASAAHETITCSDGQGPYPVVAFHVGRVTLTGNWIGNNTQDGVRVRSYVTNSTLQLESPWANMTRNRVANNSHGIHLQGVVVGGNTYSVWADVHDNNTVGSFGAVLGNAYAVWVDAGTVDLAKFRTWWNDVRGNANEGMHVTGDPPGPDFFHAECNWWNDDLGPHDPSPGVPDQNDNPAGQPVSDWFHYKEDGLGGRDYWLDTEARFETECTPT